MTNAALKRHFESPTLPRRLESRSVMESWSELRGDLIAESVTRQLDLASGVVAPDQSGHPSGSSRPGNSTPILDLPHFSPLLPKSESFNAIQEWEGVVTSVTGDTFQAKLIDITADEREPNEMVELSIDDLQDEDVAKLKPGAIFRWVIGYAKSTAGMKTRGSRVYFRRIAPRQQSQARDIKFDT